MSQSFDGAHVLAIRDERRDTFKTGRVLKKASPILEFPALQREDLEAVDAATERPTRVATPKKPAYPVLDKVASAQDRGMGKRLPRVLAFVFAFASLGVLCGVGMSSLTPQVVSAPAPQLALPNALALTEPPKADTARAAPGVTIAPTPAPVSADVAPATTGPVALPPPPKAQVAATAAPAPHKAPAVAPQRAPAKAGAHKPPPKKWKPKHR